MHQFPFELQYTEIWYWIARKTNKHRTAGRIMAAGMPYMNIRFKLPFAKNLRFTIKTFHLTSLAVFGARGPTSKPHSISTRMNWPFECEQWDDQNSMARSCPGWSIPRAMWTVFFLLEKFYSWRSWNKGYARIKRDLMKRCQVAKSHNHPFQSLWKRLWNMQHAFYMPPNTIEPVT